MNSISFGVNQISNKDQLTFNITYSDGSTGVDYLSGSTNGEGSANKTLSGKWVDGEWVGVVEVTVDVTSSGHNDQVKIDSVSVNADVETTELLPLQLVFDVAVQDSDGDVAVLDSALVLNIGDVLSSPTHEFNIGASGVATPLEGDQTVFLQSTDATSTLLTNSTLTPLQNG